MISRITGMGVIKPANTININHKLINFKPKYVLEKDTVSFSGKKKVESPQLTTNVEKALSVQSKMHKLYRSNNLSFETIQETLNHQSPVPIEVMPMDRLPETMRIKNVQAYMQPVYNKDLKMEKAIIYLGQDFSNKRKASNIIADCVHEYTHVLQRHGDNDYIGLAKFTSNIEEARFLNFIGVHAMGDMEKFLFKTLNDNNKFADTLNKKSKLMLPLTKEDVKPYMPEKEELMQTLDGFLDDNFKRVCEKYKIPQKYSGEYNFFYYRSKPTLEQSVIRQFEMESEAKSAEIEARKRGLLFDSQSIFAHSVNKSIYDAFLETVK